jgi:predicted enzyme related to lactoylglutathione lyase
MSNPQGSFVWHDLMTTDTKGAEKFYDEVAGWGTEPFPGPTPYTMWTNDGTPIGGSTLLSDDMRKNGVPPNWTPSVGVESVDATAAKAAELGGKIVAPPMDIPGAGRYAIIQDPQGASLAIFAPSGEMQGGGDGALKKGDFSWHELITTDYVAAFDFYSKLFGWEKKDEHDMGPMGIYLMFAPSGQSAPFGGMFTMGPDMKMPPNWLSYIKVDDAKSSTETVTRAGGKVMNGPMEVPGGDWIAQCMDPQGVMFAVHAAKKD